MILLFPKALILLFSWFLKINFLIKFNDILSICEISFDVWLFSYVYQNKYTLKIRTLDPHQYQVLEHNPKVSALTLKSLSGKQ